MDDNKIIYQTKKPSLNILVSAIIVLISGIFSLHGWINNQINLSLGLIVFCVISLPSLIFLVPVTQYSFYENYVVIKTPFSLFNKTWVLDPFEVNDLVYYANKEGSVFRFYFKNGKYKNFYIHTIFSHREEFLYALKYFKDRGCKINKRTYFHKYREFDESEW